jgi:hypothetical protein
MADITDPTAVGFCNENIRQAANAMAQLYGRAVDALAEWTARGGASMIPNDASKIIDWSANDSRPEIVGSDVHNIVNRLSEIKTDFEASGSAKLNTILAVATDIKY